MRAIVFIFVFFFSGIITAQTDDRNLIQEDAKSFVTMFQDKNINGILDMTYPALFESFDKETLSSIFQNLFSGDDELKMDFIIDDKTTFEVSEIETAKNGSKFAFVKYPSKLKMIFLKQKFDKENKEMMVALMKSKDMNATFVDDSTLVIEKQGMMIALKNNKTKGKWKYLNHDEDNPLFSSILEEEIGKKAKEYYKKITEK